MATPFVGEIRILAGNYAPAGWALCAGQTVSISEYQLLYTLLGTTFGGDGTTTFGLPDLRGIVPVGQGSGPGLSARVIGQAVGSANVTLVPSQMPAHRHVVQATNTTATAITPGPGLLSGTIPSPGVFYDAGTASPPGKNAFAPATLGMAGSTQPHGNMMPTASVNYMIATDGIFPSPG